MFSRSPEVDEVDEVCSNSGRSKIREFFEIRRPKKSTGSVKSKCYQRSFSLKMNKDISKDRTYVKHTDRKRDKEYRSREKNEAGKVSLVQENTAESRVKQIVRQIERSLSFEDSSKSDIKQERLCNSEALLPTFVVRNEFDIKYKVHDTDSTKGEQKFNKKERKKVKSFVEAESKHETEDYRRSLIEYMDSEVAKMKLDGFLDNDEEQNTENSMAVNGTNVDHLIKRFSNTEPEQFQEETLHNYPVFKEEFNEGLSDAMENGSYVVEAYNDDGRELILVQIMVERKSLCAGNLEQSIVDSDLVFYESADKTLSQIDKNVTDEPIYEYMCNFSEQPPSNRSTLYSLTSRDSCLYDDDDEGIVMVGMEAKDITYNNARRETFCDDKGIVRIERVEAVDKTPDEEDILVPISPSPSSMTPYKKLEYIVNEIKSTEKKYIRDLTKIVKQYKPYIEKHSSLYLIEDQKFLFSNIVDIYHKQRNFLEDIEKADDINDIVRAFIDHETLFRKYPTYFRNKPKADRVIRQFYPIIKKMQEEYDERLDFSAYLLTPLQRLGKYILFLENILSQLIKLELPIGSTQMALDIVKKEMSKGNDFVAIESIQNSPISKLDYGSFKMREKFNILKPRRIEAMVFLFVNVVVITTSDLREMESFNYFDSITMNDLRIATFDDLTIHLTNFTKSKRKHNSSRYTYILEAKTEKVKQLWTESIERILWQQLFIEREKSLKINRPKMVRSRAKSTGSSVFYI